MESHSAGVFFVGTALKCIFLYRKFQISKNGLIYFYGKLDYYDDYYGPDFGESTSKERICLNYLFTARVLFASNGNAILGQAYNAQIGEYKLLNYIRCLTLLLLNTTCHVLANRVDPDQLASEEAN